MKKYLMLLLLSLELFANEHVDKGINYIEKQDFKNAVREFKIAAQYGSKIAKLNLAVMYSNGYGVKKDQDKASKLIEEIPHAKLISQ